MEKHFHYVYVTTNLITGKQYVGDKSCNCFPEEDKNYLGSGRPYFQNALKEYGKENFKKQILECFDTRKEAFDAQEKYIRQYNTLVPNGYNISPKGGHNVKECWSEESKKKCSETKKGKPGYWKGKHLEKKRKYIKRTTLSPLKGKHLTNEHRFKISLACKNRKIGEFQREKIRISVKNNWNLYHTKKFFWMYNLELNRNLYVSENDVEIHLNEGWHLGRKIKFN